MLYVCIPVHNEAPTIGVLLWKLRAAFQEFSREYELVVYDDGSTDATAEVLEPYTKVLPLTVLRGRERRGLGAAIDALARHVAAHTRYPRRDAMILMEGDFTDRPEHIPELVKRFEGGADLVVTERKMGEKDPTQARRLRRVAPWILRPFVRVEGVADLTSTYRLIRISALRDLLRERGDGPLLTETGWAANAELLLALVPFARRVESLPVEPRYEVRPRESRVRALADAMALARFGWRRRRGGAPRPAAPPRPIADPPAAESPRLAREAESPSLALADAEAAPRRRNRVPREGGRPARAAGEERPPRDDRPPREERPPRDERPPREERPRAERAERRERPDRPERPPRPPRPPRQEDADGAAPEAAEATTTEAAPVTGDAPAEPTARRRKRARRGGRRDEAVTPTDAESLATADASAPSGDVESAERHAPEGGDDAATGDEAPAPRKRRSRRSRKRRAAAAEAGAEPGSETAGGDAAEATSDEPGADADAAGGEAGEESGAPRRRRSRRGRRRGRATAEGQSGEPTGGDGGDAGPAGAERAAPAAAPSADA